MTGLLTGTGCTSREQFTGVRAGIGHSIVIVATAVAIAIGGPLAETKVCPV
jgi:hypothetical protein